MCIRDRDYKGRIVADLFGEQSFFDDAAQFWALQSQAIAERRDRLLACLLYTSRCV